MKTWLVIALGFSLLACGSTKQEKKAAERKSTATIGLGSLCDDINGGVQNAAREITLETEDREVVRIAPAKRFSDRPHVVCTRETLARVVVELVRYELF